MGFKTKKALKLSGKEEGKTTGDVNDYALFVLEYFADSDTDHVYMKLPSGYGADKTECVEFHPEGNFLASLNTDAMVIEVDVVVSEIIRKT